MKIQTKHRREQQQFILHYSIHIAHKNSFLLCQPSGGSNRYYKQSLVIFTQKFDFLQAEITETHRWVDILICVIYFKFFDYFKIL